LESKHEKNNKIKYSIVKQLKSKQCKPNMIKKNKMKENPWGLNCKQTEKIIKKKNNQKDEDQN